VLSSQDPFVEAYGGVNPNRWSIGVSRRKDVAPQHLGGYLDELQFYDVALSAEQIGVLAIPEPGCLCLIGIGGVCLLAFGRRHKRRVAALVAVGIVIVGLEEARAGNFVLLDPPSASTSDAWNGATITDHTPGGVANPWLIDTAFGDTTLFGQDPVDYFVFDNTPTTQFVEWQIDEPSTIASVGVFLQHDGSDFDNRRALDVTILAKVNPGDTFTPILTQALSDPVENGSYGGGQFGSSNVDYFSILDVDDFIADARFFRAEFTPNTVGASSHTGGRNTGVRVLELDGYPVPEPGTTALLLCAAITLLGFAWRRRRSKTSSL